METLRIAGGGLAGLACGIRLREKGQQVEVHERRHYPLKKVCGEFLSPRGWSRCLELGIEAYLPHPPVPLKRARFYYSREGFFDFKLEAPAWGISREALDTALAKRFEALGGILKQGSAIQDMDLDARGRPIQSGKARWIGWKGYLDPSDAPPVLSELQMLMMPILGGYCGISPIEDGRISVCFVAKAPAILDDLFRSHPLLERLSPKIKAHASIAGFDFSSNPGAQRIGDARRVWPPLVGDGMSRALGAGMDAADASNRNGVSESLQFALSKAAHSFMLFDLGRAILGPLLKVMPVIPETFYRFSRG
jgi:flavin-dependent dehydrogenase